MFCISLQFLDLCTLRMFTVSKIHECALLNIGEEPGKGNVLTQATYKLLEDSDNLNFVGNIEGRDLFLGKADVIVCDGFTGNVVLKEAEGIYAIMRKRGIRDEYLRQIQLRELWRNSNFRSERKCDYRSRNFQ